MTNNPTPGRLDKIEPLISKANQAEPQRGGAPTSWAWVKSIRTCFHVKDSGRVQLVGEDKQQWPDWVRAPDPNITQHQQEI